MNVSDLMQKLTTMDPDKEVRVLVVAEDVHCYEEERKHGTL